MPSNRYFTEDTLVKGTSLYLTDEEAHHLLHVMRAKVGSEIELVNGRGELAKAEVITVSRREAKIQVAEVIKEEILKPSLFLAMAIPKMNHLEWVVEKATELNVTEFWLFPGSQSEKQVLSENQTKRLSHLAISAMKQCGRLDLPLFKILPSLLQWPKVEGTLLIGDPSPSTPYLWNLFPTNPLAKPIIFFVGPEKGFSTKEQNYLIQHLQAIPTRLHPNILRTETAPLVALSLIQLLIK